VKIAPVDTEVAFLRVKKIKKKKKKLTQGKIYSPSGKFAEQAKQQTTVNAYNVTAVC